MSHPNVARLYGLATARGATPFTVLRAGMCLRRFPAPGVALIPSQESTPFLNTFLRSGTVSPAMSPGPTL